MVVSPVNSPAPCRPNSPYAPRRPLARSLDLPPWQPESGTTSYTYNTTATKTDAKGQKTEYTYDSLKRVTKIVRKPNGTTADTCQQADYYKSRLTLQLESRKIC